METTLEDTPFAYQKNPRKKTTYSLHSTRSPQSYGSEDTSQ